MNDERIEGDVSKRPGTGMAITSMVMGISSVACCGFLLGIPAIILSAISLNRIGKGIQSSEGKGYAIAGLVTGIVGTMNIFMIAIMAGMLLPALSQAREKARRISCASNLKATGLAIRMYAQEYNGQFPDKSGAEGLEMLRVGGYLENVKMYTCPSTTTCAKDGKKLTDQTVSYVYVGGLGENSPPDSVLMYDKPTNHLKYGNVLYADGHVQGYAGTQWMANVKK